MALSPGEQQIFDSHVDGFDTNLSNEAQASWDFRTNIIANFLIDGAQDPEDRNYEDMCQQIAGDYMLDAEGIARALDFIKQRRPLG